MNLEIASFIKDLHAFRGMAAQQSLWSGASQQILDCNRITAGVLIQRTKSNKINCRVCLFKSNTCELSSTSSASTNLPISQVPEEASTVLMRMHKQGGGRAGGGCWNDPLSSHTDAVSGREGASEAPPWAESAFMWCSSGGYMKQETSSYRWVNTNRRKKWSFTVTCFLNIPAKSSRINGFLKI